MINNIWLVLDPGVTLRFFNYAVIYNTSFLASSIHLSFCPSYKPMFIPLHIEIVPKRFWVEMTEPKQSTYQGWNDPLPKLAETTLDHAKIAGTTAI